MDKDKLIGQYRMRLGALMRPVMMYGFQDVVPGLIQEAIPLALWLHESLNGKEIPPPVIRNVDFGPDD